MQQEDKDTMAKFMMVLGLLVLIAAIIFLVAQLLGKIKAVSTEGDTSQTELVAERVQPIGTVASADKAAAGAAAKARSPKDIYGGVCASCHDAGVLGAPKFGNAGDWGPRIDKGIDTLVNHAINGFNAMPPRGGDATLSDEDVRKTVEYMVDAAK